MVFRDWSKNKALAGGDYPPRIIMEIPIEVWTNEETQKFVEGRVEYYESLKEIPDDKLPFCTPEERWAKPSKYAVMKHGRKSAVRVLDTAEDAQNYMLKNMLDSKHYVEERPGEAYKRCEYCSVSEFCNQYKNYIEKGY